VSRWCCNITFPFSQEEEEEEEQREEEEEKDLTAEGNIVKVVVGRKKLARRFR